MYRNSTSFPISTYEYLRSRKWDPKHSRLLYHQFIVTEYLLWRPEQRGLLIRHDPGLGKTRTAITALASITGGAARAVARSHYRKTVIFGPKSIHDQMREELKTQRYAGTVQYVSLRANNMSEQVERLDMAPGIEVGEVSGTLDDSFLIIDEAHDLFSSIVNGSRNAVNLYDMIMSAKRVKLLLLTGTPIVNTPFELVPCYNMLSGFRLFPEVKEDFDRFFISDDGREMINRDKFINRIMGLTSYFGEEQQSDAVRARIPPVKEHIVPVLMSDRQYALYSSYRDLERDEASRPAGRRAVERWSSRSSAQSSYRVRSRMASNLVPISGARDEDILNPESFPKGHEILKILKRHADQTGIILSGFVNNCGLQDVARLLLLNGWEAWEPGMLPNRRVQRYAFITGSTDEKERTAIRTVFSARDNQHGEVVRCLMLGPAAMTGVSLRGARWGIMMDPFFNATRDEQGPRRIQRIDSNNVWPEDERGIDIYTLLADYPASADEKTRTRERTTDMYLHHKSRDNRRLHRQFFTAILESAIDCMIHKAGLPPERAANLHCRSCNPDGRRLWTSSIDEDLAREDPCSPPKAETVEAEELNIDVDGRTLKFMHRRTETGDEFYEYRDNLGGYVPVARNHPHYQILVELVASH